MPKKLTITLDEEVYHRLYQVAGRGHISQYIENLLRPKVLEVGVMTYTDLEEGYRQMAADEEYEAEAIEWIEADIGECLDDLDDYEEEDSELIEVAPAGVANEAR